MFFTCQFFSQIVTFASYYTTYKATVTLIVTNIEVKYCTPQLYFVFCK